MTRDVVRGFLFVVQLPITIFAVGLAISPLAMALIGFVILSLLMGPPA